jgi:hypothetical protein
MKKLLMHVAVAVVFLHGEILFGAANEEKAASVYQNLTLSDLGAFPYDTPQSYDQPIDAWVASEKRKFRTARKPVIPAWIRKLDGAKVSVAGFMVPFDVQENGVTSFILVKNIMICCYGLVPKVNENIMCEVAKGQKEKFYINIPIKVFGTLSVGEVKDDGYVLSLYRLAVERIEKIDKPDPELMKGASQIPASRLNAPPTGPPKPRDFSGANP